MLLAARCAACDRPGPSPCPSCHADLRPPVPEPDLPGLDGLVALLRYDGAARALVARIKYRNHRAAVPWLAGGLAAEVRRVGARVDVVTGDRSGSRVASEEDPIATEVPVHHLACFTRIESLSKPHQLVLDQGIHWIEDERAYSRYSRLSLPMRNKRGSKRV